MSNPIKVDYTDQIDSDLVKSSIRGDKEALQNLVIRHQIFIYNLALKLTKSVEDAEDLTQEVFIKAITALAKFEGKSKFRTWLYRIAVNHFINARKSKAELQTIGFEDYFNEIDNIPSNDLTPTEQDELKETIEEIRISCTAGMLLCLDREQRLVYILGEMFGLDHNMASEILGFTAGNFRIRLMRARKDLYNWMNARCGLVNTSNPCRCARKTRGFIENGTVDPKSLVFNTRYKRRIYELSQENALSITNTIEDLNKTIFQQHPLQEPLTSKKIVDEVFGNQMIKFILSSKVFD